MSRDTDSAQVNVAQDAKAIYGALSDLVAALEVVEASVLVARGWDRVDSALMEAQVVLEALEDDYAG